MSKAFTKEDSGDGLDFNDPQDSEVDAGLKLLGSQKNYITPEGLAKMRAELHDLLHVQRPEVVKTVSWAASNGDRSENGDYIYGKKRLREIDRRIRFLNGRLDRIEVVETPKEKGQGTEKVLFGAFVKFQDEEERVREIRIVGIDETDPAKGWISWISPIGKALLQAKVGDSISVRTPKGDEELTVLEIRYGK
jgi:transcription elongation factor GreB